MPAKKSSAKKTAPKVAATAAPKAPLSVKSVAASDVAQADKKKGKK
ncbi:hypothetical protein [Chitinimonas sp. BJB300]|nr:hypothetical protein [Chitinimonas sp. BJB300]